MFIIYDTIIEYLEQGKTGVLATIVNKKGPAPQGTGAKIFIGQDRRIFGTIGGGCVEAEIIKEAKEVINCRVPKIVSYSMNNAEVAEEGMICGGTVDLFLEPVMPELLNLYKEILSCLKNGEKIINVTKFGGEIFEKSLLMQDNRLAGSPLEDNIKETLHTHFDSEPFIQNEYFIEPLYIKNRLFIYGAGHISQFISRIAKIIDFEVTVIDDRFTFANRERFPEADRVIAGFFADTINELDLTDKDYHIIVTRGHRNDADVLYEIIKKPSFYIGMIGSKRKIKIVYKHLSGKGIDPEEFKRVHAPIGLSIDAITPQEIAVSIAAELIQVRAKSKKIKK